MKRSLITIAAAMFLASTLAIEPAMAQTPDPITAARYTLVIDGVEIASFSSLDGIVTGGQVAAGTQATPDAASVTLHRGVTGGMELWAWHKSVAEGATRLRKDATLLAYSTGGAPVMRFYLTMAWPSRLEISALKVGSSEVLTETATFSCTHITRSAP
jgi:phage tail-like protein